MRWSRRWLKAITGAARIARAASITISAMFHACLFNLNFAFAATAGAGTRATSTKTTTIKG
jgi:hypothetical protein